MQSLWLLPFPTPPPRGLALPGPRRGAAVPTPFSEEGRLGIIVTVSCTVVAFDKIGGYIKKATDDLEALAQGTADCSGGGQALYRH